jgi:uncharacterized membrane protein
MEARARLFGHSIHQMLIPFPFGLLATGVIFDIVRLAGGAPKFSEVAYWMIAAGVIGGLVAAPFGTADWTKIPSGTRAKRIGAIHGIGNVVLVVLFAASWWLRSGDPMTPSTFAYVLSFAGLVLALVTGWLGGELVDRLGVGVDPGAHVDAPSSLSGQPVTVDATTTRSVRA